MRARWLDLIALGTYIVLMPLGALVFMWAYSLAAPTFGWPQLDYWPAFGLLLALRIVLPPYVVRVER